MAKRFTDTDKWKREWFRELNVKAKTTWMYLCDQCDHAGIWIADFGLISFQLGSSVAAKDLADWFGNKLVKIDSDKYFIPSFFDFQYGTSKDGFKAKQSAIEILRGYGLVDEQGQVRAAFNLPNTQVSVGGHSPECPSISISKSKSISKSNSESSALKFDFAALYAKYPLKKGRGKGLLACKAQVKTEDDYQALGHAIDKYRAMVEKDGTDQEFIKHFPTFMNCWRDFLDDDYGTVTIEATPKISIEAEAEYVRTAIKSFGTFKPQEAKQWLGDARWRAVQLMGGWPTLCRLPPDQFTHKALVKALSESLNQVS